MFHIVYSTLKKFMLSLEEAHIPKVNDWQKVRIDWNIERLGNHSAKTYLFKRQQ